MIHLFQSGRRLLFFPRAWANSVTNWLLGLHSPNGTLRIVNTATPAEGKGASIDVDMEHVSNDLKERLHNHFTTSKDVKRQIERAADGSTTTAPTAATPTAMALATAPLLRTSKPQLIGCDCVAAGVCDASFSRTRNVSGAPLTIIGVNYKP